MDNFQKYSRLMLLFAVGIIAFILFFVLLIFILRLFSITVIHIPGFDIFYQFTILLIPYIIFFAAYFYLYPKIRLSKNKASRIIATGLVVAGVLICAFTLILSIMAFLNVSNEWLKTFDENSHYAFIIQLVVLLISAGVIAGGDAKEKDWKVRNS